MIKSHVRRLRFSAGRWLIHLGLRILPLGRVRNEIYDVLLNWGSQALKEASESSTVEGAQRELMALNENIKRVKS